MGVLARAMLVGDEHLTFIEGNVRRSIGGAFSRSAPRANPAAEWPRMPRWWANSERVNVSAEALVANDFHLQGEAPQSVRDMRVALDAPLRIGRSIFPAHAEMRITDHRDGTEHR